MVSVLVLLAMLQVQKVWAVFKIHAMVATGMVTHIRISMIPPQQWDTNGLEWNRGDNN